MPKEPQLALSNMVDKRLGVFYLGVWDMIFSFYVKHNSVAGSQKAKGIDFTFRVMGYHPRFTGMEEDNLVMQEV